jgi:hypothetical protein
MCKASHYIQNLSAICSVFHLIVISLERYFAILYPFAAKYTCTRSRAKKIIFFTWFLSFLAATPVLFGKSTVIYGNERVKVEHCVRVWPERIYWQLFEIYRAFLIFIIPITIMSFVYFIICRKIWSLPRERIRLGGNIE